jgi:transcriptional regulator GlxA family with amidase domain
LCVHRFSPNFVKLGWNVENVGCLQIGCNDIKFVFLAIYIKLAMKPKTVVLLTYEGAQLLDMTGPASVFTEANEFVDAPAYRVVVASPAGGLIAVRGGIELSTVAVLEQSPRKIDTLIVSGGTGKPLHNMLENQAVATWFRRAAKQTRRIASSCTGAFVLAHWGLLDGRRATTHWQAADTLRANFPLVQVEANALFVEDGPIWTSAGVSTGIDMALAMIEQDLGRSVATAVAKRLVLQTRRPGHQSQFSSLLDAQGGRYAQLVQWMNLNLRETLTTEVLASQANQSVRTFCRRFVEEAGMPPAAFVEQLRLDCARTLLEAGELSKTAATKAGFGSQDRLWRAFNRAYALNPSTYRALHHKH